MNKILYFVLLLMLFSSCRDIFESDISQKTVAITAPFDNSITENSNVTFQWSSVEGATSYHFLIVSPRFDTIHHMTVDSLAPSNSLTLSLNPGRYQWKVRAENNAYKSSYSSVYSFTIDSSYNLNNQSIILNLPLNITYYNDDQIQFDWQNLYAADSYNIVIKQGNDWTIGTEVLNDYTSVNSYANTGSLVEGTYTWSIRGSNNLPSNTPFAVPNKFYLDYTSPPTPFLVMPVGTTTGLKADSSYVFNWTRPTDIGIVQSPLSDTLKIYTDTLILPIFLYYTQTEDIQITLPLAGTYFWRVNTYDKAGNRSVESVAKAFTVQ